MSIPTTATPLARPTNCIPPPVPRPTCVPPNWHEKAPTTEGGSSASGGGLFGLRFNIKETLLYGAAGAILGVVFPFIPGGPIGGALIGAGLAALT